MSTIPVPPTGSTSQAQPPQAPPTQQSQMAEQLIADHIEKTREQLKSVELATAFVMVSIFTLGFWLVMSLVDHWVVGLATWGRYLVWTLYLAGVAFLIRWQVLPVLFARVNPLFAAKAIEQSAPGLKNSVINFQQLSGDRTGVKEVVFDAIRLRAAVDLQRSELDQTVDTSGLMKAGVLLAAIAILLGLYQVGSPKSPLVTAQRVFLPWANVDRPTRVQIVEVKPGNQTVYHGQQVSVEAEVRGLSDDEFPNLVYSSLDGQVVDRSLTLQRDGETNRYVAQLPGNDQGVQKDLVYSVIAGDDRSSEYLVKVLPAPTIFVDEIEFDFPTYTRKEKRTVSRQGDIRALEGTRVTIHARANHAIKRATIEFLSGNGDRPVHSLTMKSSEDRASVSFDLQLGQRDRRSIYDGYRLKFVTPNGESNLEPVVYEIQVLPDLAPEVEILQPITDPVTVPLDGSTLIELRALDPDYGLTDVQLHGRRQQQQSVFLKKELLTNPQGYEGQFIGNYQFQPRRLGLKVGDEIVVWAVAKDNRRSDRLQPNVTQSSAFTVKITPPSGLSSQGGEGSTGGDEKDNNSGASAAEQDSTPSRDPDQNQDQSSDDRDGQNGGKDGEQGKEGDQDGSESGREDGSQSGSQDGSQSGSQDGSQSGSQDGSQSGSQAGSQSGSQDGSQSGSQDGSQSGSQDGSQSGSQDGSQSGSQDGSQSGSQDGSQSGSQDGAQSGSQSGTQSGAQSGSQDGSQSGSQSGNQDGTQPGQNGSPSGAGNNPTGNSDPSNSGDNYQQGNNTGNFGERGPQKGQPNGDPAGGGEGQSADKDYGSDLHDGEAIERILEHMKKQGEGTPEGDGQSSDKQDSSNGTGSQSDQADSNPSSSKPGEQNSGSANGAQQNAGQDGKPEGPNDSSADQSGQSQQNSGSDGNQTGEKSDKSNPSNSAGSEQGTKSGSGSENEGGQQSGGQEQKQENSGGDQSQQPGQGSDGQSGSGKQQTDQDGSAQASGDNADAKKQTGGADSQESQEPNSSSQSKKQSSSSGEGTGEQSGGGKKGGGQGSQNAGNDHAGSNSASDEGANAAPQQGTGQTGEQGGDGPKSDGKTGQSGSERGEGSQSSQEPGGSEGEGNQGSEGQDANDSGDARRPSSGGNSIPSGGGVGSNNASDGFVDGEVPDGDAAVQKYSERATELALEYLKNQKNEPDPELLKKLGWSQQDLSKFLNRWDKLQQNAVEDKLGERKLRDAINGLGLRPQSAQRRSSTQASDGQRGLSESGSRSRPPSTYLEQFDAFKKGAARSIPSNR